LKFVRAGVDPSLEVLAMIEAPFASLVKLIGSLPGPLLTV
jgi:hypothetical protein